jgi:hypothetical protein
MIVIVHYDRFAVFRARLWRAGGKAITDVVSETEEQRANFAFFTD